MRTSDACVPLLQVFSSMISCIELQNLSLDYFSLSSRLFDLVFSLIVKVTR